MRRKWWKEWKEGKEQIKWIRSAKGMGEGKGGEWKMGGGGAEGGYNLSTSALYEMLQYVTSSARGAVYNNYVAAKATYIRLLHGKIGILEGFFGPSSVHRGRTHIVLG